MRGSLSSQSYFVRNPTLAPQLEKTYETPLLNKADVLRLCPLGHTSRAGHQVRGGHWVVVPVMLVDLAVTVGPVGMQRSPRRSP